MKIHMLIFVYKEFSLLVLRINLLKVVYNAQVFPANQMKANSVSFNFFRGIRGAPV